METNQLKENCLAALSKLENDINNLIVSNETIILDLKGVDIKTISRKELDIKLQILNSKKETPVIYRIVNNNKKVSKPIYSAFAAAKVKKLEDRSYSRLNEEDANSTSDCLYVGTSQEKSLKKRIREHLGFGAKSTYAMHMKAWLPVGTSITIEYFTVSLKNQLSYYSPVEFLEQTLWMQEKPMFGKRSGLL